MKNYIYCVILFVSSTTSFAQTQLSDFSRIVLNTHLSDSLILPAEARNLLINKLNQITSNNGMGGSQVNPRFIITANYTVGTKDIIAGPPQMVAQNIDVTLFVGDAITNTIFSNVTLSVKGVGTNENKAFIEALKTINPKNSEIKDFLELGKNKIIAYYATQCDFIIKEAQGLAKQEKFDEALLKLSIVPDVCQECYFRCLDTAAIIYQSKIDTDCRIKLNQAKQQWNAAMNPSGAEKVADIISTINPKSACQEGIDSLGRKIESKLKADEKALWDFKMKQYADIVAAQKELFRMAEEKGKRDDLHREKEAQRVSAAAEKQSARNYEIDKLNVAAYREVAIAHARNQPTTISYNRIYWK